MVRKLMAENLARFAIAAIAHLMQMPAPVRPYEVISVPKDDHHPEIRI
jgi:hypothetical protein